jgi:hypothetical protein
MAGCRKPVDYIVPKGLTGYVTLKYKCGNTGVDGYPVLCETCEKIHEGRDWRREAEEAGETWDESGY